MRLLLVRHAIAEDREAFAATGLDDELRPLTAEGRQKMWRGARGLERVVSRLDALATSPLVRAVETADVVARRFRLPTELADALRPDAPPRALLPWLKQHAGDDLIACVGHEPQLSLLASWLLAGSGGFVRMRKGGAALLDLGDQPARGGAALDWLLTPRQLRNLG